MINLVEEYTKPTKKWLFEECYKESIKCHHNEIANYIREKYLDDVDAKTLPDGIKYSNYVMYPDLTEDYLFFHLCQYDYKIAKLYMKDKEIYNNFQINLGEPDFEEIGEGYFGPTRYYALEDEDEEEDKYHEEYLVFKIINRDYVRFKDVDNLMKIKYPSLLNPIGYDFCFSAHYRYDNIAVFFKYFEKGSLDDYLDKKDDLNQTQKYIILLGTAITLKYLNEKGISLASLHPKNILINDNFYPVISDFTISDKTIKKAIKMKKMKENIDYKKFDPYLAPENIEKYDAPFNESSNAYSFALIAFRLLSNEPLFKETGILLYFRVLEGRRPYSRNLYNEIAEFLNICWAKNAQDRPTFEKIIMMMTDPRYFREYFRRVDSFRVENYLRSTFGDEYNDLIERISNLRR